MKKTGRIEFDSFGEFLSYARDEKISETRRARMEEYPDPEFYGEGIKSYDDALRLALKGMPAEGIEASNLAGEILAKVEAENDMPSFSVHYDVSGSEVDVARFLSGEPECMMNYELVDIPRTGRVVTLVVSASAACDVTDKEIQARGVQVMSMIFAIERLGLQCEVILDWHAHGGWSGDGKAEMTIPLKRSGEELDPGLLTYAITHPSMMRALILATTHMYPKWLGKEIGVGYTYGSPRNPRADRYPEGSVIVPMLQHEVPWSMEAELKRMNLI